jgi:type IV pilus assembly protein PilB
MAFLGKEFSLGSEKNKRLGDILLDEKLITREQLALAIEKQKISKRKLGEILSELGFIREENLLKALSSQLGNPVREINLPSSSPALKGRKLGEILLKSNLITRDELNKAIEEQKKANTRLGEALCTLGILAEEKLAWALSVQLGIPYIDLGTAVVEPEALEMLTERFALKNLALPLTVDKRTITVAMGDPLDFGAINDISFASGREVRPTVAPLKEVKSAIRRFYHLGQPLQKIIGEIQGGSLEVIAEQENAVEEDGVEEVVRKGESPPIIRLVNSIMIHAARNQASDIHFEPREKCIKIRERIDGILMETFEFPKLVQGAVTSRVKIMARMDIAEKKIPQDGRIRVRIEGRDLDLRVSTLPTHYGEKITIRILDTKAVKLTLEKIGLSQNDRTRVLSIIERPQGMVLITGPTGSGKSSTLYAMVNQIKSEAINIITLEDPIEYELGGVNQVGINEKTGLTFPFALRSVLRQDPDVIMVGEMRDRETANIAIEASLTGHLVLSTLHTNTAVAAIIRLRNLGIPSYLIASSLNGIIAQRLLRKICQHCKQPYTPTLEEISKMKLQGRDPASLASFKGAGCPQCNRTGYRGRVGVFEVLTVDASIRELIAKDATEAAILKAAMDGGMRYLLEDGLEKINQGITSIEELLRVVYVRDEDSCLTCPKCGGTILKEGKICSHCGNLLENKCLGCGGIRDLKWQYCPFCGMGCSSPLVPLPAAAPFGQT